MSIIYGWLWLVMAGYEVLFGFRYQIQAKQCCMLFRRGVQACLREIKLLRVCIRKTQTLQNCGPLL